MLLTLTTVKSTYSKTSGLEAKIVELIGGDGMNPTRMVLVLGTGNPMEENRIFELDTMMYEATRITFLAKDVVVVNYTQESLDENGRSFTVKRSLKIEVLRDTNGALKGEITVSAL